MAFPFIVAAGLAVMATAKVVSWVLNSMTEEERQKQELERERTEAIRKRAGAAKARQGSERDKIYRNMAGEHAQGLLRGIREHRVAVADLPAELKKLEQIISTEVADQASSPYRKSALRREYARIEDAMVRMQEYQKYLIFSEEQVQNLLCQERFEELLELDPAEPLLPMEWLYPGKLVLVAMDEIDTPCRVLATEFPLVATTLRKKP